MPTDVGRPERHRHDVEILDAPVATVEQKAIEHARRAADHAVRSIFELAALLDVLSEMIDSYHAETARHSKDWPHVGG